MLLLMPSGDGRERLLALRGSDNYIREWLATGYWTKSLPPRVFAPHWSAFLEGNYMDFGGSSGTVVCPPQFWLQPGCLPVPLCPPYHWRAACRRHRVGSDESRFIGPYRDICPDTNGVCFRHSGAHANNNHSARSQESHRYNFDVGHAIREPD